MNLSALKSIEKRDRYILGSAALLVIFGLFMSSRPVTVGPASGAKGQTASGRRAPILSANVDALPPYTPPPPPVTPREKANTMIAEHQKFVDADPKNPDVPAYLRAMGNIAALQLGDYKQGAEYYMRVLTDYPDWSDAWTIYFKLLTCYERLEDEVGQRWVLQSMFDKFPKDSEIHAFAAQKLGLQTPGMPDLDPTIYDQNRPDDVPPDNPIAEEMVSGLLPPEEGQ